MKKFLLIFVVSLLLFVPPVWAPPTVDTSLYTDSSCASADPALEVGDSDYARATSLVAAKTYYFKYFCCDPSYSLKCETPNPGYTGVSETCDSLLTGGCPLDTAGTWKVEIYDGTKLKDEEFFTVSAAPEFPSALGFGAISSFVGFIYLLMKRTVVRDIGKD